MFVRSAAAPPTGEDALLPVLPALAPLLPGGALRRGTAVSVAGDTALLLALAAGSVAAGDWAAAIGLPDLGLAAAAGYGLDLHRLLLADDPGPHWPEVVSALAGAVGVILLRPTGPVAPQLAARLTAVLRRGGCALLVAGPWPGAGLRLSVRSGRWFGLGHGYGQLRGRQVEIAAEGRGTATRLRTARLWLPDEHGTARPVESGSRPLDAPLDVPFAPPLDARFGAPFGAAPGASSESASEDPPAAPLGLPGSRSAPAPLHRPAPGPAAAAVAVV
ncbi:hypothetical protein [Kitasatospora sp. DSM 101779]|uniref:hypothetical protein n=1 Tax=Kitasatospora sp. DSM 101779 TaxID=2853165 RepID=UPI0021DB4101|nr:hypothetical protein [Kitasatospora sp. DSM 101779]MCU7825566.1 hypothetical protein [Kitasatospora sp. DSM 101779]